MAYRLPIQLQVEGIKEIHQAIKELKVLGKVQEKVNKVQATTKQTKRAEVQTLAIQNRALAVKQKALRLSNQGVNVEKQLKRIKDAINHAGDEDRSIAKELIGLAQKGVLKAQNKLIAEKKTTVEKEKQVQLEEKQARIKPGGVVNPRGGSIRNPALYGPQQNTLGGRFASGMTKLGATRGFDAQSAMISGGFPLLFGQGPGVAAAGALGGGIGGMFGGMGGFAGGIAATALVTTVSQAIASVSKLGQALGDFSNDAEALSQSLGIQNTAQGANLKLIRQLKGEQAAYNEAMRLMRVEIGGRGVNALKDFGATSARIGNEMAVLRTKLQATTAVILNFIIKIIGLSNSLKKSESTRIVAGMQGPEAEALQERRRNLSGRSKMSRRGRGQGNNNRTYLAEKRSLEAAERLLAAQEKIRIVGETVAISSTKKLEELQKEEKLQIRIKEIMETGVNKSLAKTVAETELLYDTDLKRLETKRAELATQEALNNPLSDAALALQKMDLFIVRFVGKKKEAVDLAKKLGDGTDKIAEKWKEINQSIRDDITEGVKGLIKGTATWADMLNNIADKFLDMAINQAFYGNIMGEMGKGSGGLFGFLGNMFKADGGPVKGGKSYVVGEKGPEMFVPSSSGKIVPNHQLGGGGATNVTVNVDASGTEVQGDDAQAKQLGTMLSAAVQAELVKQKRPGGLLAGV